MEKKTSLFTSPPYRIICKNYPAEFILDKNIAKDYFQQFGNLKRVTFRPKTKICTVEYLTRNDCLNALKYAGEFGDSIFEVFTQQEVEPKMKKSLAKSVWVDDNEVEAELKSMSGVGNSSIFSHPENFRLPQLVKSEKVKKTNVWNMGISVKKKTNIKQNRGIKKMAVLSQDQLSLINLVLSQAQSQEDRFKILDARDKLLRLKLKNDKIKKSGATLGTCPDMCPEKERLMREVQHQVALYEQHRGKKMDHKKAIKQYSRSSADQESPLPHELRPVSVLQMTMCYLMHNIMDLIDTDDGNVSEWYHFLWDRTRAIRKDITQQELCSQGAVELVEQCARFHIHCSGRLVGEEPSVFDQKINTENLTKCLQTLKYMYHDLQLKNEYCPNEPEFRAYVILLNMNDGNFMWEVQQLREEIQKSPEIKFALDVYSALDKNNYVKFFKLVNSATYLSACILMRYFVQVRTTALKFLVKCYSPRITKTLFPIKELINLLGFDDRETAIDFMEYYYLPINEEKTHVILDKTTFIIPEIPYILERSLNVVESKRIQSVGRVVCGKELPPRSFDDHIPQSSFDPNGYLISKDFLEEDELEQASKQLIDELAEEQHEYTKETDTFPEDELDYTMDNNQFKDDRRSPLFVTNELEKPAVFDKPTTNLFTNKDTFQKSFNSDFASSIFGNTTQELAGSSPLRKTEQAPSLQQNYTDHKEEKSFFNPPQLFTKTASTSSIFGESMQQQPAAAPKPEGGFSFTLIQSERKNEIVPPHEIPVTSIPNQNESNSVQSISSDPKIRHAMETTPFQEEPSSVLESKSVLKVSETETISQVNKYDENIQSNIPVDKEFFMEMEKEREQLQFKESEKRKMLLNREISRDVKQTLNAIVNKVDSQIRNEKIMLFKWKIQDRKALKAVNKWRTYVSNKRKRKALDCIPVWVDTNTSIQVANELYTSSEDVTLSLIKRYKYGKALDIDVLEDEDVTKINLLELTYPIIKNRYFDLTGVINKSVYWKVVVSIPDEHEYLHGTQRIEETMEEVFQWKNETHIIQQMQINNYESVTYCIEKQKGLDVSESDANGIIFIAKDFNTILQRRIFEHLKEFGILTKVPIVIILQELNENECKLKALQDAKILSDYIILVDHLSPRVLLNSVEEGLVFLAGKIELPPPLVLDTFYSFIHKYLCTEMWRKANSFAKWNSQYKTCLRDPNVVINLYNEALGKLTKIILDRSCKEYANFPRVFKDYLLSEIPDYLPCSYQYFPNYWKSEFYVYKIEKLLKQLSLPSWQEKWPPSTEFELEVNMAKYCTKAFEKPDVAFYKTMGLLLKDVDPISNFEDVGNVLWSNVIELLSSEKLNELNLSLTGTDFENKSIYNQYIVVYNKDIIEKYSKSDWFYIGNSIIHEKVKQLLQAEIKMAPETKIPPTSLEDINKTIENVTKKLRNETANSKLQNEMKDLNILLTDLETSINIHKKINYDMGEELKKAIADN